MKRLISVLLSICLMASLAVPAIAAPAKTSGAASTLRLESTEGTVQMKDAAGKALKATKGSRLYNGYNLSTQKESYAFVSLDSSKVIKLDASTSATVFQSGKKLELTASSGQLFFNVTAPLKSDESLTIRTSTMVTGVRGTCGWVEITDRNTTRLSLLEGTLTVTSPDPMTGKDRTITIQGGQTLTVVYEGDGHGFDPSLIGDNITIQDLIDQGIINENNIILTGTGLTVEALQEEKVPGFVAVEVAKDKELQKKIEETTNLSVPDIIKDAEERVAEEEAAANQKDQKIQSDLENLSADKTDPLFEGSEESAGGGGGSTPAPVRGVVKSTSNTTAALNAELEQAALDGNDVVVSNAVSSYDQTPVVVQPGQTMTLASGASLDGGNYDVQGTLAVESGATVTNAGAYISVNSTNSLEISGTLTNNGVIVVGETDDGALRILSGGELITGDGALYVGSEDAADVSGLLEIAEGGTLSSSVMIAETSSLTNNGIINGTVSNYGTLTNNGTINGTVSNYGILNHYGTIASNNYDGTLQVEDNSTTLISGAVVQNTYHPEPGLYGDGYALSLSNGGSDPDHPSKITIKDNSQILATGTAIRSRAGESGHCAYGFQVIIKDSTIKGGQYAIDATTFDLESYQNDSGETVPFASTIDITNSTLVGGTANILENNVVPDAVTINMDSATANNSSSATDTLHRYNIYFHDNYAEAEAFTDENGLPLYERYEDTFTLDFAKLHLPSMEFIAGVPREVSAPDGFHREGYSLTGWNTKPDGSGTSYAEGEVLNEAIVPTDETGIILYAQWKLNRFTVQFVLNGGSGVDTPEPVVINYGESVTMPDIQPTKENAHFIGWAKTSSITLSPYLPYSATIIYPSGTSVDNLMAADGEDLVLYAAWADYKIEYDKNAEDATGETAPSYHSDSSEDSWVNYSEVGFTRAGWVVDTWTLDKDGKFAVGIGQQFCRVNTFKDALEDAGINMSTSVITLYAHWTPSN